MAFTGINESNFEYFSDLLSDFKYSENKMYIGAIEDGKAVGAGEFSSDGNLLILDGIFVIPEYRRRGIATAMLKRISVLAKNSGSGGIWADYAGDDILDAFLKSYGFLTWEDCAFYQIPIISMIEGDTVKAVFGKLKETPEDIQRTCPFDKLSPVQLNIVKNKLIQTGVPDAEELISSLSRQRYSLAVFKNPDQKDLKAVIISDIIGDFVTIKYLANMGGNARDFVLILKQFWVILDKLHLTEKILSFCTAEPEIKQIMNKLAGYELTPTGRMMVAFKNF